MPKREPSCAPSRRPAVPVHGALLLALFSSEQTYGWSIGMRQNTLALLQDVPLPSGALLDLGCGGGALLADLRRHYPTRTILGLDLHPVAVKRAARLSPGRVVQADIGKLPLSENSVALVTALDSLDQQGVDLDHSFHQISRILRPDGCLLIRVSAHPQLDGPHDRAFNTARRFARQQLIDALRRSGLAIERITYANMLLSAPVTVVRQMQRHALLPLHEALYTDRLTNRFMATILAAESRLVRSHDLPYGVSLYALARKECP